MNASFKVVNLKWTDGVDAASIEHPPMERSDRLAHISAIALLGLIFWCTSSVGARASTERDVSFPSDSIELQGTLILPSGQTHYPAVVFLHGSGPSTREGARPYAEAFAQLGFASLIFDKRGCGSSGGSWLTASLDDLAHDALAAVAYVKSQPDVDTSRIGFWGVSQAAWVATLAAAQSGDVGFMVLISGGGASPRESEMYSYQQAFDDAGLTEAEQADAFDVIHTYFDYLANGEGRPALVKRLEKAHDSKWYPYARLDQILPSPGNRTNWSWVATWDPQPYTAKITCPVMLMFGDRDTEHPTDLAVQRWREGLKQAGNQDVSIMIFPGAGHGIRMREGYTGTGRAPFADGYAESILGWLWYHIIEGQK